MNIQENERSLRCYPQPSEPAPIQPPPSSEFTEWVCRTSARIMPALSMSKKKRLLQAHPLHGTRRRQFRSVGTPAVARNQLLGNLDDPQCRQSSCRQRTGVSSSVIDKAKMVLSAQSREHHTTDCLKERERGSRKR